MIRLMKAARFSYCTNCIQSFWIFSVILIKQFKINYSILIKFVPEFLSFFIFPFDFPSFLPFPINPIFFIIALSFLILPLVFSFYSYPYFPSLKLSSPIYSLFPFPFSPLHLFLIFPLFFFICPLFSIFLLLFPVYLFLFSTYPPPLNYIPFLYLSPSLNYIPFLYLSPSPQLFPLFLLSVSSRIISPEDLNLSVFYGSKSDWLVYSSPEAWIAHTRPEAHNKSRRPHLHRLRADIQHTGRSINDEIIRFF